MRKTRKRLSQASRVNHPREYPIFRPRKGECDPAMVGKRMLADDDLDFIRVAKHDNQVIAAYRFKQVSPSVFEICYLRVEEAFQGQGLGSWLLAHAIGIIESKGGREVITRCKQRTLFARVGFKQGLSDRLRLTLIPE